MKNEVDEFSIKSAMKNGGPHLASILAIAANFVLYTKYETVGGILTGLAVCVEAICIAGIFYRRKKLRSSDITLGSFRL